MSLGLRNEFGHPSSVRKNETLLQFAIRYMRSMLLHEEKMRRIEQIRSWERPIIFTEAELFDMGISVKRIPGEHKWRLRYEDVLCDYREQVGQDMDE